jgi:hypothetical protein
MHELPLVEARGASQIGAFVRARFSARHGKLRNPLVYKRHMAETVPVDPRHVLPYSVNEPAPFDARQKAPA